VRALRKAFPRAEITLIGLPWAEAFADRFSKYFDRFIAFPGFPGLPERTFNSRAFTTFISEMQQENFDLALQMQGSGSITNTLIELLNAKHLAGFYQKGHYKPNNDFFVQYPENIY